MSDVIKRKADAFCSVTVGAKEQPEKKSSFPANNSAAGVQPHRILQLLPAALARRIPAALPDSWNRSSASADTTGRVISGSPHTAEQMVDN